MDENKELATVEETQAEITTVPTEEEDNEDEDGSAIGGLVALIGGTFALGVGATAFALRVKGKFEKKRDEKRRKAEFDFLRDHCPDGYAVIGTDEGAFYKKLGEEDKTEPDTVPTEEKEEK